MSFIHTFFKGSIIHNIGLKVGNGGQFCHCAGTNAQLLGKDGKYAIVRLASGEVAKLFLGVVLLLVSLVLEIIF